MEIQDIMLAQDVKRWTIVRTIRDQSLAEHTFNVTMIARAIARKLNIDDCRIIKYALDHDLDEILTGDIPTPAKARLKISTSYDGKSFKECDSRESSIVAMADIIEAIAFITDNQVGRHAHTVGDYLMDRFQNRCNLIGAMDPALVEACNSVVKDLLSGKYEAENE
jgi:HD superfamily phosphodiesterase